MLCLGRFDQSISSRSKEKVRQTTGGGKTEGRKTISIKSHFKSYIPPSSIHRIIIYNYDGLEFVYKREIVAAEPPVALHILSGTVFISTKR